VALDLRRDVLGVEAVVQPLVVEAHERDLRAGAWELRKV